MAKLHTYSTDNKTPFLARGKSIWLLDEQEKINLWKNVKGRLDEQKSTVAFLAKTIGAADTHLYQQLRGDRPPGADNVQRISDLFGCPPETLFASDPKYANVPLYEKKERKPNKKEQKAATKKNVVDLPPQKPPQLGGETIKPPKKKEHTRSPIGEVVHMYATAHEIDFLIALADDEQFLTKFGSVLDHFFSSIKKFSRVKSADQVPLHIKKEIINEFFQQNVKSYGNK